MPYHTVRLVTYRVSKKARVGVVVDDRIVDVAPLARRRRLRPPADMISLIETTPARALRALEREARAWVEAGRPTPTVKGITLLAPIPRPRKNIMCMGRNYAEHARESRVPPPDVPVFFTKPPTTVIGPGTAIRPHPVTSALDYEVELAAVIGRRGRNIHAAKALDYVFGYTILIDVTARDLQRRHQQWFKGKSLDTFAPMGPWIVARSAIPDPQALRIGLRVNGETRQQSWTSMMLFSVAQLIETLSAGMTLEPGDILATGTPEGVGAGFDPPKWLQPGDVIEAEIERIGVLRVRVGQPR